MGPGNFYNSHFQNNIYQLSNAYVKNEHPFVDLELESEERVHVSGNNIFYC